jgi:hypothetical protein
VALAVAVLAIHAHVYTLIVVSLSLTLSFSVPVLAAVLLGKNVCSSPLVDQAAARKLILNVRSEDAATAPRNAVAGAVLQDQQRVVMDTIALTVGAVVDLTIATTLTLNCVAHLGYIV